MECLDTTTRPVPHPPARRLHPPSRGKPVQARHAACTRQAARMPLASCRTPTPRRNRRANRICRDSSRAKCLPAVTPTAQQLAVATMRPNALRQPRAEAPIHLPRHGRTHRKRALLHRSGGTQDSTYEPSPYCGSNGCRPPSRCPERPRAGTTPGDQRNMSNTSSPHPHRHRHPGVQVLRYGPAVASRTTDSCTHGNIGMPTLQNRRNAHPVMRRSRRPGDPARRRGHRSGHRKDLRVPSGGAPGKACMAFDMGQRWQRSCSTPPRPKRA